MNSNNTNPSATNIAANEASKTVSKHAQRRQKKKQASTNDCAASDSKKEVLVVKKSEQPAKETQKEDVEMKVDSVKQINTASEPQQNKQSVPEAVYNTRAKTVKGKNQPKAFEKPSQEEGFTGTSDDWFNEKHFMNQQGIDFAERNKHDYYFGSYSSFYIHEEMLKDKVRTEAYQRAIMNNPEDFKDKVVLDIGAGTGVLSMFAAKAGAKHVYAIEFAEIALFAKEIVRQNKLDDKITVIKGKMEEIVLPVQKVDIIISEWMGYFLLYESMLDSILWARDRYLVKGGKILPDLCTMFVAGIEDGDYSNKKKSFWNNVYGTDMSCVGNIVLKEPLVDSVGTNMIMSSSC